jgi:hypothetical protein
VEENNRKERSRKLSDTIMINGQLYREYDNGQANVLMPVDDPIKRAQLADNRRAIRQAFAIAENPIGGVAYGVAALAGGSAQQRDQAFAAGAAADALTQGAAPFGSALRGRAPAPKPQVVSPPLQRPSIRYRGTNEHGQAQGMGATVTRSMLGTGTRANQTLKPTGYVEMDEGAPQGRPNRARAHLFARGMGGTGDEMVNLMALAQNPTNSSHMKTFENRVVRKVRNGEIVEYTVTPFYNDGTLPPRAVFLTEYGSRGGSSARIIEHPPGRKR